MVPPPQDPEEPAKTRLGRSGVVHTRTPRMQRINAWRKRSPLNAYWLDWLHLTRSVAALAPYARGVLLDVGVSERPYGPLFEPHVERYIGLEYPPSILDKQPELWEMLGVVNRFVDVFGDGNRLPFRTGAVDTVLCTEVLEHLPDPALCVAELARVLKPDGKLLLTVPFTQILHELPSDYYRYTPYSIRALLERHGFEVLTLEPRGNFAATMGATLSQYLMRSLGAKHHLPDGSFVPSRWRGLVLMPVCALVQLGFHMVSKLSKDGALALGFRAVARKR